MQKGKVEIPALTGIRGIAALTVVVIHILIWRKLSDVWHLPTAWPVELFFVLSGFVLSLSYLKPGGVNWRKFFVARFARVYPLHLVTALAMAGFIYLQARRKGVQLGDLSITHWLQELTLTTAMPVLGSGGMWNDPSWSISIESWLYIIAFPVIALLALRKLPAVPTFAVTVLCLAIFGAYLASGAGDESMKAGWSAAGRGVFCFMGGWGAYLLYGKYAVPGRLTDALIVALLSTMVAVKWAGVPDLEWLLLPFFPFVVLGLTNPDSGAAKLMATKSVVFLGEISYSVYLLHAPLRYLITPVLERMHVHNNVWAWFLIYIPVVLVVSTVTWKWFEKPAQKFLLRMLAPRTPPETRDVEASF